VVASISDGAEEIIEEGKAVFMVHRKNYQVYADTINRLLENRDVRIQMGANAERMEAFRCKVIHPQYNYLLSIFNEITVIIVYHLDNKITEVVMADHQSIPFDATDTRLLLGLQKLDSSG
jgi:hypothetical protein